MKVQPIKIKLRQSENGGLSHDSREDVRTLVKAITICIDKINELVDIINKQEDEK